MGNLAKVKTQIKAVKCSFLSGSALVAEIKTIYLEAYVLQMPYKYFLIGLILYVAVNNFSVMSGRVFLG